MWLMLQRVQQSGVRVIRGDIVLDRSAFDVAPQDPGDFDGESLRPYNVVADAMMLNYKSLVLTITPDPPRGVASVTLDLPLAGVQVDRSVRIAPGPCEDWRGALQADFSDPAQIRVAGAFPAGCGEKVWAVAYADPASYNARALLGLWQALGGQLGGSVRDGPAPPTPPTFLIHSPPLAEVVRDINKFSNNVMAQQLFLTLGLVQRNAGTADAARDVVRRWASDRWGSAATAALVVDNGSGLSRSARLSAGLLAQVLQSAWAGPWMPELMASLPVSGVDGTLKHAQAGIGRAHLKTGSLRDVAGVAGYVTSPSGRRYVVVGIINHPNAAAAQPALDALVRSVVGDDPPAPAAPP
jgi:D-alanyl-D-alanine carboxypeptidase/D-alanyl-D-alanine-endopeptidase (penicillin-binding protein 4)